MTSADMLTHNESSGKVTNVKQTATESSGIVMMVTEHNVTISAFKDASQWAETDEQ